MHLIIGASGSVGRRVARRLIDLGEPVRAVSRDISRLAELEQLGAEPIRGDLRSGEWIPAALKGVRSLVLASHGLVPPTRDNHPGLTDEIGNRRIIDAANGVDQIVFVSATVGANSPVLFGQVKHRIEEHLRTSGIAATIIRPTVFTETHALLLLGEPLRAKGSVQFFGPGTTPLNWISVEDVATFVVRALQEPSLRNRTATIGGADTLSRLEVLTIIEQAIGRTARRRHLPVGVMRVMRFLAGPVHPGMHYLLDMALAESTIPDQAGWAPQSLDWTGPTTLSQVVENWAQRESLPA